MRTLKNLLLLLSIMMLEVIISDADAQSKFKSWAKTPPMGWNSRDCYGPNVQEHEIKSKMQNNMIKNTNDED